MIASALDLGLGPTPTALLAAVLLLALMGAAVVIGVGLAFPRLVDKRWPADEPLNPTERIWAEMREFVERTFAGLDLELARDLAGQMEEVRVAAGTTIFSQGDPATHFYVIRSG